MQKKGLVDKVDSGSLVEGSELEDIVNEKIESITTVDWINYNGKIGH